MATNPQTNLRLTAQTRELLRTEAYELGTNEAVIVDNAVAHWIGRVWHSTRRAAYNGKLQHDR